MDAQDPDNTTKKKQVDHILIVKRILQALTFSKAVQNDVIFYSYHSIS